MDKLKRLMATVALAVVFAWASESSQARDIFFDTFSGNQLRPHWQQPPPGHWDHTVADSRLTVSGLFHPGVPGQPNVASIAAEFPYFKIGNKEVLSTNIGWEPGSGRVLSIALTGRQGPQLTVGLDDTGTTPVIFMEHPDALPPRLTIPAPDPGLHEVRVKMDGDGFILYLNGTPRGGLTAATGQPVSSVLATFESTHGIPFSPLTINQIRIVPSPAPMTIILPSVLLGLLRRRRK